MIEKSEKEERTTQVIKKTHKGDVNINDEDLSLLEVQFSSFTIYSTYLCICNVFCLFN